MFSFNQMKALMESAAIVDPSLLPDRAFNRKKQKWKVVFTESEDW